MKQLGLYFSNIENLDIIRREFRARTNHTSDAHIGKEATKFMLSGEKAKK